MRLNMIPNIFRNTKEYTIGKKHFFWFSKQCRYRSVIVSKVNRQGIPRVYFSGNVFTPNSGKKFLETIQKCSKIQKKAPETEQMRFTKYL